MELIRINEVAESYGLSSRTLRYYEEVGILWSARPENRAQRFYDNAALERLKQIVVLRKLQIPIKDIVSIYKDNSTASLICAFTEKLESLDEEITSLSELRRMIDEFLQKMLLDGIKKISAITLLYEETERSMIAAVKERPVSFEKLSAVSRGALRLHDVRVIRLPAMRVLTSRTKNGETANLDSDSLQNLFAGYGLIPNPGLRELFLLRKPQNEWIMIAKIPENFKNETQYEDRMTEGGLFAIASSYVDDVDETFSLLKDYIGRSEDFEVDTNQSGRLNRDEMIEEILPWDIAGKLNRYQQDVFIPIRIKQTKEKKE